MAKTTTALGPLSKLLDGDTGQLLGIIDAEGRPFMPFGEGNLLNHTTATDGTSASVTKFSGMSKVAVTATGTVNYAAIYVEDADTSAIYGAFGAPMSGARWCAVPAGAINLRVRVAGFSGTSMTVTLAGGV